MNHKNTNVGWANDFVGWTLSPPATRPARVIPIHWEAKGQVDG